MTGRGQSPSSAIVDHWQVSRLLQYIPAYLRKYPCEICLAPGLEKLPQSALKEIIRRTQFAELDFLLVQFVNPPCRLNPRRQ